MSRKPSASNELTPTPLKDEQASRYLATIVASSDDALIGKSSDGTILSWNAAAERLYGYAAAEAVGRNVSIIVPPDGRDELADLLERIRRGERVQHRTVERRRKNGVMILVSLSVSPVRDARGKIIGAAAMARGMVEDRAEDAVEAASYARSLIEVSINPLVTISPQGKITDVNKATEEATGIARDQLIGTDFADRFSEPEEAQAAYQRVLEEGLLSDYPLVLRHVSGALTDVEYNATVYRDESGELQAVFAAARDAIEADTARREVTRLAAIAASSQDARLSRDLEGTITSWNAAAERLFGYAAEEAIGRNGAILMPPGREGETQELIKRVLRGDRNLGFETQRLRKDGRLLDVALTVSPIRDAVGDITALSVIAHDISRRVRAERDLRESEQKFAAAFHASPDLMAIAQLSDGKLLEVNESLTQLLGYTRSETIGTTISELEIWADPADRASFVAGLEESGHTSEFETTLRRKDGALITCIISARTMELRGEMCVLSVIHDITERKQAEEDLLRHAEQLRRTVEGAVLAMGHVVETRDPYTAGHERRVSELATAIAAEMGMEGEELDGLRLAGLIHDIGKIAVPAEILSKPGRLSTVEFELIKQHPQAGFDIIEVIEFERPVAEMVLQHHERLDGSGYPRALAGEAILPEARILAVADVVEAMSSHRPYRPALGMEAALAEVREHVGVKYDADVVATCVRLVEDQGFLFTP